MQKRYTPAPHAPTPATPTGEPTIVDELKRMTPEIQRALPIQGLSADRIARVILTEVRKNPKLLQCSRATFFGAIMECSQLGLEPGGVLQQAFLIPRKNRDGNLECNLQIGYQGYIELAERDGKVTLIGRAVYHGELIDIDYGTDERLVHKPSLEGPSGKIIGAYAIAKYKDGRSKFLYLNLEKIEEAKKRSQSGKTGPWSTDYDAMAIKTAIRRLFKFLPKSPAIAEALELDEKIEIDGTHYPHVEDDVEEAPMEAVEVDPMEGEQK